MTRLASFGNGLKMKIEINMKRRSQAERKRNVPNAKSGKKERKNEKDRKDLKPEPSVLRLRSYSRALSLVAALLI